LSARSTCGRPARNGRRRPPAPSTPPSASRTSRASRRGTTRRAAETTIASVEDIDFARYDVVALDEAQFVDVLGLVPHLETTLCIVAGLNGSFQRKPFGNLLQLVPHADDVVFCKALCARCRDGTPATFSKRLGASTALVDVGDHYAPVCRKCF